MDQLHTLDNLTLSERGTLMRCSMRQWSISLGLLILASVFSWGQVPGVAPPDPPSEPTQELLGQTLKASPVPVDVRLEPATGQIPTREVIGQPDTPFDPKNTPKGMSFTGRNYSPLPSAMGPSSMADMGSSMSGGMMGPMRMPGAGSMMMGTPMRTRRVSRTFWEMLQEPMSEEELAELKTCQSAMTTLRSEQSAEEKAAARKSLLEVMTTQFDRDLQSREQDIVELESRVKKLRDQFDKRKTARDKIIELRMSVIENEINGLGFPDTGGYTPMDQSGVPGLEAGVPGTGSRFAPGASFGIPGGIPSDRVVPGTFTPFVAQ